MADAARALTLLCLAACAPAAGCARGQERAPSATHRTAADSIACRLFSKSEGGAARTVLLRPGDASSDTFEGLQIEAHYAKDRTGFMVRVKHEQHELFLGNYAVSSAQPPLNQFAGESSFTGRIALPHPSDPGCCQLSCGSVRADAHQSRHEREAERRRRDRLARRAAITATAMQRLPCDAPALPTRDGERCPPRHPLGVRVQALLAAYALGQREFAGIDLEQAQLPAADLREADFRLARMGRASLREAQLYFCDLSSASLDGADLERANLWSARLPHASLRAAKLTGAKLQHANLQRAELTGAELRGAYLMFAELIEATLSRADLAGAFLIGARLDKARLDGADLQGADLSDAILDDADLAQATNLTQAQLDRACGNAGTLLPAGLSIDRAPRQCVPGMKYVPCGKQPR